MIYCFLPFRVLQWSYRVNSSCLFLCVCMLLHFFLSLFFNSKIDQAVICFLFHNQFDFISLLFIYLYSVSLFSFWSLVHPDISPSYTLKQNEAKSACAVEPTKEPLTPCSRQTSHTQQGHNNRFRSLLLRPLLCAWHLSVECCCFPLFQVSNASQFLQAPFLTRGHIQRFTMINNITYNEK